ncbi:TPA: hypothetical protein QDZ34_004422 [Stenotrophomonas maltophilia]|uniref:hypothetical protein n=1 Tax=Stenotrophomonas TaxID=40323 RepID=UPI0028AE7A38|nr:hypothetical protein [Stenotrophomonas sp.]HDS0950082.1 hypothetical protein [Stenotrophomonas maltophilia]HDS0951730.1 hypothetical protein [Stenotrophomonas maltophilia]HDS1026273.1 hypothetical protein [Stenotrophomonas maltophilia]HDS1030253.1 hypothetical protein [Stenotrophomonas maltophilia]HDS1032609.1 hypothetical protein [Stenotrophomonas maltophilia]
MLHRKWFAGAFSAVLALAALAPSAPVHAAELVWLDEQCVPFHAGFGVHQRCTLYAIYDDGTRVEQDHYNRDENGMMYDP